MKVIVNGRFLSRRITGVERYGREILRCLESRVRAVQSGRWVRGPGGYFWEQFLLPGMVKTDEILWSPANIGPIMVKNQVLTLHDLSALEHPEWYRPMFGLWYRLFIPLLVRRVRYVVVSSAHVRAKVLARFSLSPNVVVTIPAGINPDRFHPNHPLPGGDTRRFILFVGSLQPRKNLGILLEAWKTVSCHHPDISLWIAGEQDIVFRPLLENMHGERVRYLGYVPDNDLPGLYVGALAFVMPSFDEGFGLPVLEAMACGTPVIAARSGALPEVVRDAGMLFDPVNADQLAELLDSCLSDESLRDSLIERGFMRVKAFSWPHAAEKLWEVFQSCQ
ncbi:MAG TPA: glycosyltransferase family 1 protein [Anaerolineales bacterium]|nr:glycosyltransferase family 1 protein [Anaerolineales bacterium]